MALYCLYTVVADVGTNITIPCSPTIEADVDWWRYKKLSSSPHELIYSQGKIYDNFKNMFTVNKLNNTYSLHIANVETEDAGVYICAEQIGFKDQHMIELLVHSEYYESSLD